MVCIIPLLDARPSFLKPRVAEPEIGPLEDPVSRYPGVRERESSGRVPGGEIEA